MKWLKWGLISTLTLCLLMLLTLPYVVRDQLVLWLYDQGAEDVRLQQLSVNWLEGRLELQGLAVEREDYIPLSLERLVVDIRGAALLDKQLLIESFYLTGLKGGLSDQSEDGGTWLGPVPLSRPASSPEPADTTGSFLQPLLSGWQFGLDSLQIWDLDWLNQWQGEEYLLRIRSANLNHIYQWAPLNRTDLALDGDYDGARLHISSRGKPLQSQPELTFDLALARVSLDSLLGLLGWPVQLQLSADQKVRMQMNPFRLKTEGEIKLYEAGWRGKDQTVQAGVAEWAGKASWDSDNSKAVFDGLLAISESQLQLPEEQQVRLAVVQFEGAGEVETATDTQVRLDGVFDARQLQAARAQLQQLSLGHATLTGPLTLVLPEQGGVALESTKGFSFGELEVSWTEGKAQGRGGLASVQYSGTSRVRTQPQLSVALDGTLAARQLKASLPQQQSAALETLDWQGKLTGKEGSKGAVSLDSQQVLKVTGLASGWQQGKAAGSVKLKSLSWEGRSQLGRLAPLSLTLEGKLAARQLTAALPQQQSATLEALDWQGKLTGKEASKGALSLDSQQVLTVTGLASGWQQGKATGSATLKSLSWDGRSQLARLAPLDLMLEGKLAARQLKAALPQQQSATLETLDWRGKLTGKEASKGALALDSQQVLTVTGLTSGWQQGKATGSAKLKSLSWDGRSQLARLAPLDLVLEGKLAARQLKAALPQQQSATLAALDWQGKLTGKEASKGGLSLDSQQVLAVAGLASRWTQGKVSTDTAFKTLNWKGRSQVKRFSPLSLALDGSLAAEAVKASTSQQQRADLRQLDWQGALTLALSDKGPVTLETQQKTRLAGLSLATPELTAELASARNRSTFKMARQRWQLNLPALELGELSVTQQSARLLAFDAMTLKSLQASQAEGGLQQLVFKDLQLAPQHNSRQPVSRWRSVTLDRLGWTPRAVRLNEVLLRGGTTVIRRGKSGQLTDLVALQKRIDRLKAQFGASGTTGAGPVITLGSVGITQPHQLKFSDQSVAPTFRLTSTLQRLNVGPWDTLGKRPTDFNLAANLRGTGTLKFKGVLDTGTMQSGGWTLDARGIDMPDLSAYSIEHLGYSIPSGRMELSSNGTLAAGRLNGKTTIDLQNFNVEARRQDKAGQLSQKLSMPLETAVMIMKDEAQNIKLDLDITGSLSDPDFGYQSVINSLVGRGLKTAAFGYITRTLQPYATILTLAKAAVDAGAGGSTASAGGGVIGLQPITFRAGSAQLDSNMEGYLDKLSQMLNERPAMRLKLCGNAVASDRILVEQQLEEENATRRRPLNAEELDIRQRQRLQTLAIRRGEAVKKALAVKVSRKRIRLCYPQITPNDDGAPAVSVRI